MRINGKHERSSSYRGRGSLVVRRTLITFELKPKQSNLRYNLKMGELSINLMFKEFLLKNFVAQLLL